MTHSSRIRLQIQNILRSSTARQSAILYFAELFLLASGFVASIIITRLLGDSLYGIYSFAISTATFASLFFEFGIHSSSARLLAAEQDSNKQKGLIGTVSILTAILGLLLTAALTITLLFVDQQYRGALLFTIPFAFVIPFGFFIENTCQGTNKITTLSLYTGIINSSYLVLILVGSMANVISVEYVLGSYFASLIISTAVALHQLKPRFDSFVADIHTIYQSVISYGSKVYVGRVAVVATYSLDKILLAAFSTAASVGHYSLAYSLAQPLALLSRSISFSLFREFSTSEKIPRKVVLINTIWLIITGTILVIAGYLLLIPIFTDAFAPSLLLLPVLVLAVVFQGLYEPYNKFIVARGEGVRIQRVTLRSAVVNLLVNLLAIYYYGAVGAAFASLFSMIFTYTLYLMEYKDLTKPRT